MPKIADTVVADLSKGDDCFIVDGERFPWYIDEQGPSARQLLPDLYLVRVQIIGWLRGSSEPALVHGTDDPIWPQPIIAGIEFPWYISEARFTYRSSGSTIPTVELEFFTHSVEGVEIENADAPEDGKVRCSEGLVIARSAA